MSLADISTPWQPTPIKHVAELNPETLNEATDPEFKFRYIDIGSIAAGQIGGTEMMKFADAPSRARRLVRDGDVLVSTVRTYLRAIASVPGQHEGSVASTGFVVLRPKVDQVDPRFLRYWCLSEPFVSEVVGRSVGVSYPAINSSDVGRLPIPVPPLDVQHKIANYLDRETERIDEIVGKNLRLVALLRERAIGLTTQLLLDGTGESDPAKVLLDGRHGRPRVKHLISSSFAGRTPTSDGAWVDAADPRAVPWLGVGDLTHGGEIVDGSRHLDKEQLGELRLQTMPSGTIIFAMYGATAGKVARLSSAATFNQAILGILPNLDRVDPDYLYLWLQVAGPAARAMARSNTQDNFNAEQVLNFPVPNRPKPEQHHIVSRVAAEIDRVSAARDTLLRQNGLLAERRQALMTAAVMGDLDVGDAP